jgi:hypothetical protein
VAAKSRNNSTNLSRDTRNTSARDWSVHHVDHLMAVDVPLDHHSLPLSVRPSFLGASPGHKSFQILQGPQVAPVFNVSSVPASKTMTASNHAVIPLEPSRLQEYVSCSFKPSASPPAPVPAHLKIRGTFKTSSSLQVYNIQAPQVLESPDCFKMSHCTPPTPSTVVGCLAMLGSSFRSLVSPPVRSHVARYPLPTPRRDPGGLPHLGDWSGLLSLCSSSLA